MKANVHKHKSIQSIAGISIKKMLSKESLFVHHRKLLIKHGKDAHIDMHKASSPCTVLLELDCKSMHVHNALSKNNSRLSPARLPV